MKKFKKMMALVVAAVMIMAMAVPTMAATITLKTQKGHTYEVYQVYTGTVDGDTLTEVKYGQNHASGKTGFVEATELAQLKTLSKATYANDQAKIAAYKDFVDFESTPIATVAQGTATADLPAGWYVIRDEDDTVPTGDAYKGDGVTLYMFQVLNDNLNISAKSGTVESEKHVDDQNDSNASDHSELKDSADYDIGDLIPYTLTFKLPENYHDYLTYYVKFTDTMSAGLSYNGDAKIYYGKDDTTGTAIDFGTKDATGKFEFEIEDLKTTAPNLDDEDVITIKYHAYLNDNAVIGDKGNPNTYTVEFNNNPNNSGKGKPTGTTPEDKNIVFTYKTIFDKVDENGKALPGADFILKKKVDEDWVDVRELGGTNGKHPKKIGTSEAGDTTFSFEGLDAGDYKLIESFTPEGYNTIADIEFTITAEHVLVSDNPTLTSLTGDGGESITLTPSTGAGSLKASIENKSGAVLPSTGGVGTTMFYIVGAILAVGAGILLVTRRRMDAQ